MKCISAYLFLQNNLVVTLMNHLIILVLKYKMLQRGVNVIANNFVNCLNKSFKESSRISLKGLQSHPSRTICKERTNYNQCILKSSLVNKFDKKIVLFPIIDNGKSKQSHKLKFILMSISGLFGLFQTKEEQESDLITLIKRAVLSIQRDEFKPAEQLLHLALKMAQEQQNEEGITYIYDLMANLAFQQGEYPKAEKLFISVMQRVMASGVQQDDLKIIHMSLKLAKIYEERKDFEKAEQGFKFCIEHLEKKVETATDEDTLLLWAMTLDWYARFLHEQNRLTEAFNHYKKAYDMCVKINGEIHEQTVILLNDLGTISFLKGDNDAAIMYLTKAVETGKHLPNMEDFSSVYVNLGNIYMQKHMYEEAKKLCKEGQQNATRHKNEEGMKEATVCLEELKHILNGK